MESCAEPRSAEITSAVSQLTIPNIYRKEHLFESVAALVGSIQVVPVAMWTRSNENVSITETEADVGLFDFFVSQKSHQGIIRESCVPHCTKLEFRYAN